LEAEYQRLAERYQVSADEVRRFVPARDVRMDMASAKALDIVRDSAVVVEKPAESDASEREKRSNR
jgi:trigger factor